MGFPLTLLEDGSLGGWVELCLLAVVQGLTEFLPVSSSGHLVLAQAALGIEEPTLTIEVALHVGTLLAVVVVYWRDLVRIAREALGGQLREVLLLATGTLPAVLVGLLFKEQIQDQFGDPRAAARFLLLTAAILLVGEWGRRRGALPGGRRELGYREAFLIGLAQCLAMLPGVSRSGSTISAGLLLGLAPERAARFSFLLSIPAILGAAVLTLADLGEQEQAPTGGGALLGSVLVAGVVGWLALRLLLNFLDRGAFRWFALYCAALGGGYLLFA